MPAMADEKAADSADAGAAQRSVVGDGYMDPAPVAQVRSRLTLKRQFVFGKVSMSI